MSYRVRPPALHHLANPLASRTGICARTQSGGTDRLPPQWNHAESTETLRLPRLHRARPSARETMPATHRLEHITENRVSRSHRTQLLAKRHPPPSTRTRRQPLPTPLPRHLPWPRHRSRSHHRSQRRRNRQPRQRTVVMRQMPRPQNRTTRSTQSQPQPPLEHRSHALTATLTDEHHQPGATTPPPPHTPQSARTAHFAAYVSWTVVRLVFVLVSAL